MHLPTLTPASENREIPAPPASLDELIEQAGGAVKLLRGSRIGPYAFPVLPPAFTNWMDEQRAWKNECAFLELSYHMGELRLKGPDVIPLLSKLAVNKLDPFPVNRGKQIVVCNHDGQMIGEAICFHEPGDLFRLVGVACALDWVQFNVATGAYDLEMHRELSVQFKSGGPRLYMFQIQGPSALDLMRDVADGAFPEIPFFHIGEFTIKGRPARALRHGMAGAPGFEVYGPWEDQQLIREAFDVTGVKYRMRKIGGLAYPTAAAESGWMGLPIPAIYQGNALKPFRQWLSPKHFEAMASLGGSFYSDNITDYYVDPIEIGYSGLIDRTREFMGHEALARRARNQQRKKVTLVWNNDDVLDTIRSSIFPKNSVPGKYLNLPFVAHALFQYDAVMKQGRQIGVSQHCCYTANAQAVLSLSLVGIEHSAPGTEVTLLWGDVQSNRPIIEKHAIREIRATVAPAPYFDKKIKTFAA